jgi:ATPase involved in DNA repair
MSNFKCFEDEDISFSEGVTVIHGVNGSGKSSLLDAVYFTLYGSDSLASDDNLATPITNGEEHMKVDLWFTHNGNEYHVNREIRERNSGVAHNASIEGPDVQRDGPTDTDEFIVDLFNMDASSFTNCSYVRQEDASKLIEASASDRKDMIDELLQIGVLEDYRERTHSTVVAASNVHDQKESVVDDLEDQIEEKEDGNPEQRLGDVKDSIDEVTDELDRIKSKRDEKVSEKEAIADDMAEFEDQEDELDTPPGRNR